MNSPLTRRLWLVASLALLSGCPGTDPGQLQGGIEGSGSPVASYPVTSAGAVSSLGSIFVNGVEFDLARATITIDGQPAGESELDVGSLVIVEGMVNPDGVTGVASHVTASTAVAGPIDSIAIAHDGFTVLGQTVEIDAATVVENAIEGLPLGGLTIGSDVEVSGFADSSGTIRAQRIALRREGKPLLVTGYVTALDSANQRFAVNGAMIDYANARLVDLDSSSLDGARVRVTATGIDASSTITAEEVAYRDPRLPGAAGNAAVMQGWVTRYASSSDFDVDGRRVVAAAGTSDPVSLDDFVTVNGRITSDGAVNLEALLAGPLAKIWVTDVHGKAIAGALVTISDGGREYRATTDANGIATFPTLTAQTGWATFSISAPGFDTETFVSGLGPGGYIGLSLAAEGAWAIGVPIVLGTRFIDRSSDGSTMSFSVDLAVIDEHSEAIETLTGADFSIGFFDCGWGDGRDCASDADGNHTGHWLTGGGPRAFLGLQPPIARRPYIVEVLAVRSDRNWRDRPYWETMAPALRSFVAGVGGTDRMSLSSVQLENGAATHTVLGPFTSDGSIYFDAIDALGGAAGHDWPPILQSLNDATLRVAAARDDAGTAAEATVLVLGPPWLEVEEVAAAARVALQSGVRISVLDFWLLNGIDEVPVRTGGFLVKTLDARQFPMIFGAMDRVLAGTMPFYRMEFELEGEPGTFVAGGNAQVQLAIHVPTSVLNRGVHTVANVAIH